MEKNIGFILGTLALYMLASILMAYPIMWLWNHCLVPSITVLKEVTFWQAFGVKLLISLLSPTTRAVKD
jgi:hypothetical protein